jgi:tRNA pseudouridine38-40 synthase
VSARHLRLIVEYDGRDLCGWQRQANGATVQGHLEDALGKLLTVPTAVAGASRTDAGVHARGQVACFHTERAIPLHGIRRGLNSLLPDAIAIREVTEVGEDFHPRFSATGKHYRYLVWTDGDRSPRWRHRAWHRPERVDLPAMEAAAVHLRGEHDFAGFRAAGCSAKTTRRTMEGIDLSYPEPSLLAIDVRGNAFLRNMVRIMVGTLLDVGHGRRSPAQVLEILETGIRERAGVTAPPHGLELMAVRYGGRPYVPRRPVEPVIGGEGDDSV